MPRKKCATCETGGTHAFTHNRQGWVYHGCRCDICHDALTEYSRTLYWENHEHRLVLSRQNRAEHRDDINAKRRAKYAPKPRRVKPPEVGRGECLKCAAGEYHAFKHGLHAYRYHKCRCDICTDAKNHSQRQDRSKNRDKWRERYERSRARQGIKALSSPGTVRAQRRASYERNREKIRAAEKERHQQDPEKTRARNRAYYHARRGNPEYRTRIAARRDLSPARRAKNAKHQQKRKSITVKKVGPWTPEEDALLLQDDWTLIEMALKLGRSYGSVNARRFALRHGLRMRPPLPDGSKNYTRWSTDEDELVVQGIPLAELADRLGRSRQAINLRRYVLRRRGYVITPTGYHGSSPGS